ncbi:MAG: Uma2 family endonuclease, partial [Gemmataceae bacterium]
MATTKPRILLAIEYDEYAEEYLRSLPPEHFMESYEQSTQRKITVESLDLVHARRPEVQVFSELLVQYPYGREPRPRQVVPDNMVVLHDRPIKVKGSFNLPLQPVGPFWVLEYVSKESKRKDYDDNFLKYERELKVPYYLIFYPDEQELSLYRLTKRKYVSVKPNSEDRLVLEKLDLEIALLEGWCRFWHCGKLLPLPADLLRELEQKDRIIDQEKQRADQEKQRADQEKQRADQEKQRAEAAERELELLRARLRQMEGKRGEA